MNGHQQHEKICIFAIELYTVRNSILLLFVLCLGFSFNSSAHDYYFSYSETEYNEISGRFETTIVATAHDVEKALADQGEIILEELTEESPDYKIIEKYLNQHFSINSKDQNITFDLIGIEVDLNGTARFYLESSTSQPGNSLEFKFDLLMDEFEEQQNKMTFLYRGQSSTVVFLQHKQVQTIELSKQ
jgi:hypothetical protein